MPFYIISNESYVKDDKYKFGFSSKSKHELLNQYEKNKRIIPNPFILKWWDDEGSIKKEKQIHNILNNIYNVSQSGEWYKCNDLLYIMKIIDEIINNIDGKIKKCFFNVLNQKGSRFDNEKSIINIININKKQKILINYYYIINLFNIQEYKKMFDTITFNIDGKKYIEYEFFLWYIDNNIIKDDFFIKSFINNINDIIKDYIFNIDITGFRIIIKNAVNINITGYKLNVFKGRKHIETDIDTIFSNKEDLIESSKDYIYSNKKLIFEAINMNSYFIKKIKIGKIIVIIKHYDIYYEIPIDEYETLINSIKKRDINFKSIKFKRKIYFDYDVVLLNNNILKNHIFEDSYNLLDLDNENFFKLILNENIHEEFNAYFNNKLFEIKKYHLYQLLYYNRNIYL